MCFEQRETGILEIGFERDNILDILMAKDLTENALIEIANISADKRALREVRTLYLNEIDFDNPVTLRTFTANDTL